MRTVDLFAGWGGFSLGAERAGAEVILAANHWRLAVDAHKANHPHAEHLCQDLNQANFYDFPDMDLLLASPACQGHSTASQPKRRRYHDALRSTAWAVVSCADAKEPEAIVVENVVDFRRWRLYPAWCEALRCLGYTLEEHVAMASRFGVPQRRKRLIITAVKARHGLRLQLPDAPEPGFGDCIDWSETRGWAPVSSKPFKVQERIAKARRLGRGETFLTQYVTNHPGVPLDEPIRTITTKAQWALVHGDQIRMLNVLEHARAMGFPDDYRWPEGVSKEMQIKGLGNAVCPPVAEWFTGQIMEAA
jgi:DNA (cytosine-5)-methyltransferase 1